MDATPPTTALGLGGRLVRACLLPLYPRVGAIPGLDELQVDTFITGIRRDATPIVWLGLLAAALAYQLGTIWTLGLPWPAAWLGARAADRHADKCSRTRLYPLRQATLLLKTFGGMYWGADPQVRAAIGWSGH